ncbi:PglY protein [Streptomyces sp. NPDC015350]|uniref:PglY protein n=1 Tax=Streptomyces sp. NPDC015350 TaxID=3364955 RepID=UPI0036FAAB25
MSNRSNGTGNGDLYLRDVLNLPDSVLAGSFKVDLSEGIEQIEESVDQYVVTPNIDKALRRALTVVRESVRSGKPNASYLHGSFGSGKSHFMTVLHAILDGSPAARTKPALQPIIADHDSWMRDRKFLKVPFHLVGATDLDSAILGGYVRHIREAEPTASVPPVYRADAMLEDARRQREFFKDDEQFVRWLGDPALPQDEGTAATASSPDGDDDLDDLEDLDLKEAPKVWTPALLNEAFDAAPGEKTRNWLVSALLSGPYSSYAQGALGAKNAYLPLENGLDIISRHAKSLGYDGLILFIDELILWLQAHLTNRVFVNDEVNKLVKLIESGTGSRPLPIVSFISRQRDLSELIGANTVGVDAKNLEAQLKYLAGRIDPIDLEDRNLPEIVKERVLKPRDAAARSALDAAFAGIETSNQAVRDVLLDPQGATHADWADFRALYPVSPVLLNVLVALSGALQRERTGLKLLQQLLYKRRDDLKVGQLIPLGDLWDVLAEDLKGAFTERLTREAEAADRFHGKVREFLLGKYGSADDSKFIADERFVKTLLLAYLAPEVPALARLTGPRLAALNHGSIRSRTGQEDRIVVARLRDLQARFPGELRTEGTADPVFTLHLSDLDVEPILDSVGEKDTVPARKRWVQEWLWRELGIVDDGGFVSTREIVWHGTKRTAEFVFENVRDRQLLPSAQFEPSAPDRIRFVIDYPFDEESSPSADENRVRELQQEQPQSATIVWLPSFLATERVNQLGRLLKINYLLDRDHLKDFATHLSSDDQIRVRHQLEAQRETLVANLGTVLHQAYGINKGSDTDLGSEVTDGRHVHALYAGHTPELQRGGVFEYNLLKLADGLFDAMYPKHPNFDRGETRKAVSAAQFRKAYEWIVKAMDDGSRRVVVDSGDLGLVAKIVHPLELGEVHDGPLNVSTDWRRSIDQQAGKHQAKGDYKAEDIRTWIADLGWTGLDRIVSSLVITTYALLSDRSWLYNGEPMPAPSLDQIGPGWTLRAQELPGAEEFAAAHTRAAAVFGTSDVPTVLFARNVNALAQQVREKAETGEGAVDGLRRALERFRSSLGISGEQPTARELAVREAADLLARIKQTPDATPLARDLAAASYRTTDVVLGKTISSAQAVLDALDGTDWQLIDSLRGYTGRGDALADRSQHLLTEIAEAAAKDEFDTALAPVLTGARRQAVALINEAARLSTVAPPVAPVEPPAPTDPSPEDVGLTDHGQPSVPSERTPSTGESAATGGADAAAQPVARRVRRLLVDGDPTAVEQAIGNALAGFQEEIRTYAAAHPGMEIEIHLTVRSPQHGSADAGSDS